MLQGSQNVKRGKRRTIGQMGQPIATGTITLLPGRPLCLVQGSLGKSLALGFSRDQVGLALDAEERRETRLIEHQLHVIVCACCRV